jgi:hypothetical protein
VGVEVNFFADATLDGNLLAGNPAPVASFDNSQVSRG